VPRSEAAGPVGAFAAPLENVTVFGETTLPADMLYAIADDAVPDGLPEEPREELVEKLAASGGLGARIVADASGARLEGSATLPPGAYTLYARREGKLHPTNRALTIDDAGQTQFD
jgi:hypothetical protein